MSKSSQKVLWLTVEPPGRQQGGGAIREFHLLRAMARRATTVLVMRGALQEEVLLPELAAVVELDVTQVQAPASKTLRRARDLSWALRKLPAEAQENEQMRLAIAASELPLHEFDHVLVEHIGLAPLLPEGRQNHWILNLQQLGSRRARQALGLARTRRQRWAVGQELKKAVALEQWAMGAYDLCCVPSDEDAAELGPGAVVVPNGVDVQAWKPTPIPAEPRVILTGTLNTAANLDGAQWLAHEVMPLVRRLVPDVTLDIVGRNPVPDFEALGREPGITLHVDVPDVAVHLKGARVATVPLRIGSGTRIKALEAMASGRPVVGTTIGLEGLHLNAGVEARVADDADGFADGIVRLLKDDEAATAMAEAARRHVEAEFDWDVIAGRFADRVLSEATGPYRAG
ncbi:MAG: polysaccharide biosynthesis protein PslH [Chloroflexota bacterium]|jgi:glycosyltransferase involved in cell wall biosynthesis|nr:polysaccharide biosynthesis protein PslH [Chloroflexota bacterium]